MPSDRQMFHVRTFQSGAYAESRSLSSTSCRPPACACSIRNARRNMTTGCGKPCPPTAPCLRHRIDGHAARRLPQGVAGSESPAWSWSARTPPGMVPESGAAAAFSGYPYANAAPAAGAPPGRPAPRAPGPIRCRHRALPPRWAASAGRAHRACAPRRTRQRFLGRRVGPDSPPRSPPQEKGVAGGHGAWDRLAALSFLVALGFLFAFLTREPPAPAERSPDAPAAEQPLFGPAVPVIYKHVPAKPKEGATSERGTDRVRTGRQTGSVAVAPAQGPPRGYFPGHSRQSGHGPAGAGAFPRDLNRDDTPQPGPGVPALRRFGPGQPGCAPATASKDNGSVRKRKALLDFFRPPCPRNVPRP